MHFLIQCISVGVTINAMLNWKWCACGPAVEYWPHLVLAAAGFSEVGNGRELGVDGLTVEPAVIQIHHCLLGVFFTTELHRDHHRVSVCANVGSNEAENDSVIEWEEEECVFVKKCTQNPPLHTQSVTHLHIYVSNQIVSQVIAHVHLLLLSILLLLLCEDLLKHEKPREREWDWQTEGWIQTKF